MLGKSSLIRKSPPDGRLLDIGSGADISLSVMKIRMGYYRY